MPYYDDESKVKRPTDFIKLEDGDVIILQSNVYTIATHFLNDIKRSVLCGGDGCYFCQNGNQMRYEYYYHGLVNGKKCIIRMPASVFYQISNQEKFIQKKDKKLDKRDFDWGISKEGSGLNTKYTVTKGDRIKRVDDSVFEANKKSLINIVSKYEKRLEEKALEIVAQDSQEDSE